MAGNIHYQTKVDNVRNDVSIIRNIAGKYSERYRYDKESFLFGMITP